MAVKPPKQPNQSPPAQPGDNDAQYRRFVETARQLEADEDVEKFERKLGRIASVKSGKRRPTGESG